MLLIEELEARLETEESPFRAQLLREDIARLRKLVSMAGAHGTAESFAKDGLYIGWTHGDFRTHELKDTIQALLAALYAYETGGRAAALDRPLRAAWEAFDRDRMTKLLGCL